MDPVEKDIMDRPPRRTDEAVITRGRMRADPGPGSFHRPLHPARFRFRPLRRERRDRPGPDRGPVRHDLQPALPRPRTAGASPIPVQAGPVHEHEAPFRQRRLALPSDRQLSYIPCTQRIFRVEALSAPGPRVVVLVSSSLPLWAMEIAKLVEQAVPLPPGDMSPDDVPEP